MFAANSSGPRFPLQLGVRVVHQMDLLLFHSRPEWKRTPSINGTPLSRTYVALATISFRVLAIVR